MLCGPQLRPRHCAAARLLLIAALAMLAWSALAFAADAGEHATPKGHASANEPANANQPQRDLAAAERQAHALMRQEPPQWEAARSAFEEAAESGSPTAMGYLGWLFEEGRGVEPDMTEAARWYARAARAGDGHFALKRAWMSLRGDGVPRDRAQAEAWFEQAIADGHEPARTALASLLIADAQGGRAPERVFEAHTLLQQALAADEPLAAYFLARLYLEGIGGHPIDPQQAAAYTRLGAEQGDARLQGWMAAFHATGRGVEADPVAAAMWATLAAAGGDAAGQQLRPLLEQRLSAPEVAEARRMAVDWALTRRD